MPIASMLHTKNISKKAVIVCQWLTPCHSLPLSVICLLSADLSHTQQFSVNLTPYLGQYPKVEVKLTPIAMLA